MPTPLDAPVTVEYYYKVKWGYQDEFIELFRRNHYPILAEQAKSGRLLKIQAFEPRFHGEGRGDWTFMTVLVFRNWQALGDGSGIPEIIQRLFPDQATYKLEEQRRFEILDAHWDVPLKPVPMES
jgi:hypothetical protein